MPKLAYTCQRCHQPFSPDPRNVGRQRCRRKGKRERQNQWRQERYAEGLAFREAAKKRGRRRRRREKAPVAPAALPPLVGSRLERVTRAVLGLASQLGGEDDPTAVVALVDAWAQRGARLGVAMASGP